MESRLRLVNCCWGSAFLKTCHACQTTRRPANWRSVRASAEPGECRQEAQLPVAKILSHSLLLSFLRAHVGSLIRRQSTCSTSTNHYNLGCAKPPGPQTPKPLQVPPQSWPVPRAGYLDSASKVSAEVEKEFMSMNFTWAASSHVDICKHVYVCIYVRIQPYTYIGIYMHMYNKEKGQRKREGGAMRAMPSIMLAIVIVIADSNNKRNMYIYAPVQLHVYTCTFGGFRPKAARISPEQQRSLHWAGSRTKGISRLLFGSKESPLFEDVHGHLQQVAKRLARSHPSIGVQAPRNMQDSGFRLQPESLRYSCSPSRVKAAVKL